MQNSLRRVREMSGMSQSECAEALGLTRQTIVSIEQGHYDPPLTLAFRIARLFDVTVEDVFSPDE